MEEKVVGDPFMATDGGGDGDDAQLWDGRAPDGILPDDNLTEAQQQERRKAMRGACEAFPGVPPLVVRRCCSQRKWVIDDAFMPKMKKKVPEYNQWRRKYWGSDVKLDVDASIEALQPFFDLDCFLIAPDARDRQGRLVVYFVAARFFPNKVEVWMLEHIIALLLELLLLNPQVERDGVVMCGMMEGMGWANFNAAMEKTWIGAMNTVPIRLRSIFMVNPPLLMRLMLNIIRPFMSAKMRSRLTPIASDKLTEHIAPENLPIPLGGTLDLEPFSLRRFIYQHVHRIPQQ